MGLAEKPVRRQWHLLKSSESGYPDSQAQAFREIHSFTTAISKALLGQSPTSLI